MSSPLVSIPHRGSGRRAALRRWRPTARLTELQLLVAPALATVVGLLTIYIASRGDLEWDWRDIWVSIAYAACIGTISIGFSLSGFRGDQILLPVTATLAGLGLLVIQRLQPDLTARNPGYAGLAEKQLAFLAGGLVLMTLTAMLPGLMPLLRRYKYTALLVSLALLAVTFVFGTEVNGARLWLDLGPFQMQPSEVVKVTLVLFLAAYLDEKRDVLAGSWAVGRLRLPPIPSLLPMGIMWAASLLTLVVLNDLGSALLFFGIFLVMLYVATGRILYVAVGLGTFALACAAAYQAFGRIAIRVQNWLDPWRDPLDSGYQQVQSDYAISSGGVLGTGLGLGRPYYIPEVQTDYVFSAIAEELGLLGALAIIVLILTLVLRAFMIGLASQDGFERLVCVGLGAVIGLQTLIILGGVVRLIPLTGITLPFISYGGSSLITNFIIIGLLLNLSNRSRA